ncbi:MAG: hypothetical protein ACRDHZ_07215 [Ktedonobacteraceae bacterium]
MKKQGVTFVMVRALARQLQSQADFLFQLVGEEERTIPQIQEDLPSTRAVSRKLNLSNAEMDAPPADWLARQAAGGPPAHWLQRVQQDAPALLTSRGYASRHPLPSKPGGISKQRTADEAGLSNQLEPVASDTPGTTHTPDVPVLEGVDMQDMHGMAHEEAIPTESLKRRLWSIMQQRLTPTLQLKKWGESTHVPAKLPHQKPEVLAHEQNTLHHQENWDTLEMVAGTTNRQARRLGPIDEQPLPPDQTSSECLHQPEHKMAWQGTIHDVSAEETLPVAAHTTYETLPIAAHTTYEARASRYQSQTQGSARHTDTEQISSSVHYTQQHAKGIVHREPNLASGFEADSSLGNGSRALPVRRAIPRVRLQNIVAARASLRQNPEHISQSSRSADTWPERWPELPVMPNYSSNDTEPYLPTNSDNAAEVKWPDTYFIVEPTNRSSRPSLNNVISAHPFPRVESDFASSSRSNAAFTSWPALPDEKPNTTGQDWGRTRQAWQHQQRLDAEQRGDSVWNA